MHLWYEHDESIIREYALLWSGHTLPTSHWRTQSNGV